MVINLVEAIQTKTLESQVPALTIIFAMTSAAIFAISKSKSYSKSFVSNHSHIKAVLFNRYFASMRNFTFVKIKCEKKTKILFKL